MHAKLKPSVSVLIYGICVLAPSISAQTLPSALSDAKLVVPVIAPPTLGYLEKHLDARFGLAVQKVTDSTTLGVKGAVPVYSQLQAWNSDMTWVVVKTGDILDAKTWKKVHKVDYGWPGFGNGIRWSPTEPLVMYFTGGLDAGQGDEFVDQCGPGKGRFVRYRLTKGATVTAKRELVHCFSEYPTIARDPSYEELSDDGRYVALVGRRPDGVYEAFAYDITAKVKFKALELPKDAAGTPRTPDWAGMSPSGKYVLCMWGKGPERFKGLEAYDRETMAYMGKVTTSSGHGDLTVDAAGNEYYVYTNANNASFLTGNHYIVRSRIPNGVVFDGANVNPTNTVNSGASTPLVAIDWLHGVHVSCRATRHDAAKGCVVSTISGTSNGQQAFEKEIFWVALDSKAEAPKVERLAQHHSDVEFAAALPDAQCPSTSYWVQPHATLSPDGRSVLFGSSWGKGCSVEAYLIDLTPIRPAAIKPGVPGKSGKVFKSGFLRGDALQSPAFDGAGKRLDRGRRPVGGRYFRPVDGPRARSSKSASRIASPASAGKG